MDNNYFRGVRYLAGTSTHAGVTSAGVWLVCGPAKNPVRAGLVTTADLTHLGHFGNDTAGFLHWLVRHGQALSITVDSRDDMMVAVLRLPDGESNPGLALLNRILAYTGQEVLSSLDLNSAAGLERDLMVYLDQLTPDACRLAFALETLLLKAINRAILHPNPAQAASASTSTTA